MPEGSDCQGFIYLVLERDRAIWVVEWKTDRVIDPDRHRDQLALYADAVRRWRDLASLPHCALACVGLGKWVEM